MSSRQIEYILSCTHNTMPMELFLKLASDGLKDEFLFNLAEIEFRNDRGGRMIHREMMEWLRSECVERSVFDLDSMNEKLKIYFEDRSDLIQFKLRFDNQ